ncbi:sporulation integral membrane protein YlbJ [Sporolactobacillus kofuensis]|uniref:Sporulation integral membrane protein YlbJ n=1 Tax=Sporolactobacillus kofuensis TaxID=269672 RepID=A0ABW1WDB3_9BACL|nr:sporulation integral membrane protein YlbJ [Sporolactobacillus kofuensis]MCO7174603.1 sporulation integral membrane protein YlbJ [Sporolactobacillus kofuensis]
MNRSKSFTYLLAAGSVTTAFLMIRYPDVAIHGSVQGLTIWWDKVFPALFPFFVLAELMIAFGVVSFAGVLMEPIMRPIFRLPGIGGFVFMMGLVSGFPAGARITAQLYKENRLSKSEAERLASFTNFSNPLFLFSVTAVSFFHQASLGIVFALAHYIGNIGVGLMMRFNGPKITFEKKGSRRHLISGALMSMHQERIAHDQPFGKKLGDAVIASVNTLLAIGGFIALFSMLYQLLLQIGIINLLNHLFSSFLKLCGFSASLGPAAIPGLFELTIGDHAVAETSAPLIERVVLVSGLLGFCGFSIQAQAMSILSQAGLSPKLFFVGRFFQMIFSSIAAYFLFHLFKIESGLTSISTFAAGPALEHFSQQTLTYGPWITFTSLIIFILLMLRRIRKVNKLMK